MKKQIRQLIMMVISLIMLNSVIWSESVNFANSTNKIDAGSQKYASGVDRVINIPGQLSSENNIVFTRDGSKGLVSSFKEENSSNEYSVYSFNTLTGSLIDKLDSLNSSLNGVNLTKLTIGSNDVLIVSAKSSLPDQVDFIIIPINTDGSFAEDSKVNLAFRVPLTEDEQNLPNEISLSLDGSYGIYSNKTNIFVFSTASGQIISNQQIILESGLSANNRIESFSYDQNSGRLALVHQQNGRYFVLVYSLNLEGELQFERRIRLPKGEVIGYGSKLAFDDLGSTLYLVSANLGQFSVYDLASGSLKYKQVIEGLAEIDKEIAKKLPIKLEFNSQTGRLFIQKPGHISVVNTTNLALITNIDFNQSLSGAVLAANGQKVYVLSGNTLETFLVDTSEKIESRTLAPKSLNLSLYTQSDLLGIAISNGVQLIYQ